MQYSSDGSGLLSVIDERNVRVFDRASNINVAGWSNLGPIQSRFKNVTESTGKADSRHSSTQ